jgi:endonuclease/exonuclease/phosphatase (EEP) superfamily protein YafD
VGEVRPDLLILNEVSAAWRTHIETLKPLYPNQLVCSAQSRIGSVAILSSRPFAEDSANGCSNAGALAFQIVDFGGQRVMVGAAHLLWPWPEGQPEQLTEMRGRMKAAGRAELPLLFAGDLNAARWSHSARRTMSFLQARALTIPGGTWLYHTAPADWISRLGLPIDNVFVRAVDVVSAKTLRPFGSDHLPVLVKFSLTRKSGKLISRENRPAADRPPQQ